ncbi:MAG: hypothetical protein OEZ22_06310 [Spirochaetia bacterium]|nr:hypothetical protein [Spirochaetia bacterium]
MSKIKKIYIFAFIFCAMLCYYDPNPPEDSELYDERPILVLNLTGCSASSKVFIRYWDSKGAFLYPSSYPIFTNTEGGLLKSLSLTQYTQTVSFLLYVDQNQNDEIDTFDFGIYQTVTLNTLENVTREDISCIPDTLIEVLPFDNLTPESGQKICVYTPADKPIWNIYNRNNIPEYPELADKSAFLTDWFPAFVLNSNGTIKNNFLISGSYHETCVYDYNLNNLYESSETITTKENDFNVP